MSRRLVLSLGALLVGTALLGASGLAGAYNGADGRKEGTLLLSFISDPVGSLDPALAYSPTGWRLEFATCAKLFNLPDKPESEGARVVPEVVRTSMVSRDGRTYTFDLKRSFRFHTGAAVTARSYADAFNRDANPRLGSRASPFLHEIAGADAVLQGKAETISGVRVVDRYRLQIRLTRPLGDFTARLTMPFFCPIPPGMPSDPGGIDNPPGSGPYYIAERTVNQRIVLKRNPYYRGSRPGYVDQVVITIGGTRDELVPAVEQNTTDYLDLSNLSYPDALVRGLAAKYGINQPDGRFFVAPGLQTSFFAFNHDRTAFKGAGQIPLAKAINYAIDRPELARRSGYLSGRRTAVMLPPALGGDESLYPLKGDESLYPLKGADVPTARRWYARARVKPDKLVLYASNDSLGVARAQVFAYNLKQIGIDVDVKTFDITRLFERVSTRGEPFDVLAIGWSVDYADPSDFFIGLLDPVLHATRNTNFAYFVDARVRARMAAANRLTGAAPRRKAWTDLDVDLMRTNPPWAPFLHSTSRVLTSRTLGCFFIHPVYVLDIAAVCKK